MHLGKALLLIFVTLPALAAADTKQALDIRPHEAPAICGARFPQLEVLVTGVEAKGILTVELYAPSKRDFLRKDSRLKRIRVPAESGSQTVCFDLPAAGRYALAAYHDVDGDRDLARKWNMMPAEPFAISSNKPLRLGVPRFDEVAFSAGERTTWIQLELKK